MKKFKICPECNTQNPPDMSECQNCDCDLIGVPVSDNLDTKDKITMPKNEETFRQCTECGHKNPANSRKCLQCGEDISDILPSKVLASNYNSMERKPRYFLKSIDNKIKLPLNRDNIIIGRDNELSDYLISKTYVSRKHCRIYMFDGDLYIEDLGSSNSTFVNNKRINGKVKLSLGDEIGLGGAVLDGSRQEQAAYFLIG